MLKPSASQVDARDKMATALCDWALPSMPECPAPGKWTKTWHALIFTLAGICCHSFLAQIVPKWLQTLAVTRKADDAEAKCEAELDPALTSTVDWARIAGKRARKVVSLLNEVRSTSLGAKLLILGLVDEPLRLPAVEFLSSSSPDMCSDRPLLLNLVNPAFSPVLAALQYLSTLLFAGNQRLVLLLGLAGSASLPDWEAMHKEQVRLLRRMVLLVSSWIQRRHQDRVQQPPWSLCALADPKAAPAVVEDLLVKWSCTEACCLRAGFARTLKERGLGQQELQSSRQLSSNESLSMEVVPPMLPM